MKMKWIYSCLILGAFFFSFSVKAEEKAYEKDEYSKIKTDGQLVPVGEKHRYRNVYNTWNVWANPFGFFFGSFIVGGSYAFHKNLKINLEPQLVYYFPATPKVVGGGGTVSMSIFFNRVYEGFYLEPGARVLYVSQDSALGGHKISGAIGGPQLVGGWGWLWDSGFNINLGIGIGYYWGNVGKDIEDTNAFQGVVPAGNLQFGYTF